MNEKTPSRSQAERALRLAAYLRKYSDEGHIAGHVGTAMLASDRDFHGVYHDGKSHYYIDGTVNESGRIPILAYDEASGKYWEMKYPA